MSVNGKSGARILSFENDVFVTTASQFDVTAPVGSINSPPPVFRTDGSSSKTRY